MASKSQRREAARKKARENRGDPRPSPSQPSDRKSAHTSILDHPVLGPAIAISVTLAAYVRSFGNQFVYDDHEMIILNSKIGEWSFLWKSFVNDVWWFRPLGVAPKSNYYRPLEDVWLGLNFHLFGYNPIGWHVTIVMVHLVVVWLVYEFAAELTRSRWTGAIAAMLFGLMPIHVQVAVWPSAIPISMAAAFTLGAMIAFMRRERSHRRFIALALALYAGGLLSHESAIVLPILVGAYVFAIEQSPSDADSAAPAIATRTRAAIFAVAPFIAMTAAYLAMRLWVLGFINHSAPKNHAGIAQVILSIPGALANYVLMLVIPWRAATAHHFEFVTSAASPGFYIPAAGLAVIAASTFILARGFEHRDRFFFLALWGLIAIAPVMNLGGLVPSMLIQDRYLYLPSVAWAVFLADLAAIYWARGGELRSLIDAIAITVLALCAVVTWHLEGEYHDEIAFFGSCVSADAESSLCHGRYAMALESAGDLQGAEREFIRTIEIDPDEGAAQYNLGHLYGQLGRYREAADMISRALKNLPELTGQFYLELASVADRADEPDRADAALKHAEADPETANSSEFLRAQILARHRDYADAEKILATLAARVPNSAPVWIALGSVRSDAGDMVGAIDVLTRGVALDSSNAAARVMLAKALHAAGRDSEARAQARRALAIAPENPDARALTAELQGAAGGSQN